MIRKIAVAAAVVGSSLALSIPAHADTPITITIAAGALSISAPTAAVPLTLTTAAYTGSVTPIDVLDGRGTLLATPWTASASLTNFVNGSATVAPSNTTYLAVPNLAYVAPVGYTASPILPVPQAAMSTTAQSVGTNVLSLIGKNAAEWSASLITPASNYTSAGTYTATMVHSVA